MFSLLKTFPKSTEVRIVVVVVVVVAVVVVVYVVVVFVANRKDPKSGSAFTHGKNMMYLTAGEG